LSDHFFVKDLFAVNHEKAVRQQRIRRRFRVRKALKGTTERPRLSVHRTHKHIYCQVIDDVQGKTLVSASTVDKDLRSQIKCSGNREAATMVGQAIAQRLLAAGIKTVCLDRGCFRYHGRVAAVADAVRAGGVSL
jgi:large subunit ribosomal protein L18